MQEMEWDDQPHNWEDPDEVPMVNGVPAYPPIEVPPPPEAVQSFDGTGPRLIIKDIINENFKSYAGVTKLGPFHKNFTCIVGPNGSGKSNVIDSMLFVFGYRSAKIRSKNVGVLIHNSDHHKEIESCTVTVCFQKIIDTGPEDADFTVVPGSAFNVSRTALKDNSSIYRIDDTRVTYKQIANSLRGSGIDLDHNRFLILQGEVEQIAMMKPKAPSEHEDGMLEFLEDIIGSSRYQLPIEQLAQRVEKLNVMRADMVNRVKLIEKEKNDLEGVRNEAIEFLTLQNDITRKKNKQFHKYLVENEEKLADSVQKRDEVSGNLQDLEVQLKDIVTKKKDLNKHFKKISKEYSDSKATMDKAKQEFKDLEKKEVADRESIKHAKDKVTKLEKKIKEEEEKLSQLQMLPNKLENDIQGFAEELDKLHAVQKDLNEQRATLMKSLEKQTKEPQKEKAKKEEVLGKLKEDMDKKKSKHTLAVAEHNLYMSNLNNAQKRMNETKTNLEEVRRKLKIKQDGLNEIMQELPTAENKVKKLQDEISTLQEREKTLQTQKRSLMTRLEEGRSAQAASSNRGKVLDALMALKQSGEVAGIYGRLGDLGAIHQKYDVAISTACGSLDYILVDTVDTASKCIDYLKRKDIGRATFIALDKQRHFLPQCNSRIKLPSNAERLFDLVEVKDETIRPAFYFALRDTLVTKDLTEATKIGYGETRYRVVTLDGALIETSGTMSGGGGRVSKGRMGTSVVQETDVRELGRIEDQLQKLNADIEGCRGRRVELNEQLAKESRTLKELQSNIKKLTNDVNDLKESEPTLVAQFKQQTKEVLTAAPDENRRAQLEDVVESLKAEYEIAQGKVSELEDEIHVIHNQILEIGGDQMKGIEKKLQQTKQQADKLTREKTKAEVGVKTAKGNVTKSGTSLKTMRNELADTQKSLEDLKTGLQVTEDKARQVGEAHEGIQDKIQVMRKSVEDTSKAVSDLEEQEQGLNLQAIDIKAKLERLQKDVEESQDKIIYWKQDLDKLSLHVIEGVVVTLQQYNAADLQGYDMEKEKSAMTNLESKLDSMKPNIGAIEEYKRKEQQYLQKVAQLDAVTDCRDHQSQLCHDLKKKRTDEFMEGFSAITNKLKEMYQMITLGGDAELELVDSLDPFTEGIVFSVRPPKKSWKHISNLSGGEKTLSSLALVFALHHYKPTPLYVMDEIDAALDFKNVSIVANYIKERTKNAQFIIISLRNNMFELSDRLVGIYKVYNCTGSVTINPKKISLKGVASIP